MNNIDIQTAKELDKSLKQLAEILKKIGIQEIMINEDSQYHITQMDNGGDANLLKEFCAQIHLLYSSTEMGKNQAAKS